MDDIILIPKLLCIQIYDKTASQYYSIPETKEDYIECLNIIVRSVYNLAKKNKLQFKLTNNVPDFCKILNDDNFDEMKTTCLLAMDYKEIFMQDKSFNNLAIIHKGILVKTFVQKNININIVLNSEETDSCNICCEKYKDCKYINCPVCSYGICEKCKQTLSDSGDEKCPQCRNFISGSVN
jgi:hypothetical protein